ncbi:MAG TPA: hypothetical protein VF590_20560, partial [Isosphaeraceae bacterium]
MWQELGPEARQTLRRVMLRMVDVEGGSVARRRAPRDEFAVEDPAETERAADVLGRLGQARLIVEDIDETRAAVVEPAHDERVRGWGMLWRWVRERQDEIRLLR